MNNIDRVDNLLIGQLRMNARTPVAALAKSIGVSRATIQNRMHRLEKRGIIKGYSAVVAGEEEQTGIRALMSIALEGNTFPRVCELLLSDPSVTAVHSTNGRWDIVLDLQTQSLPELNELLERVRAIDGVTASETSILLSTKRGLS